MASPRKNLSEAVGNLLPSQQNVQGIISNSSERASEALGELWHHGIGGPSSPRTPSLLPLRLREVRHERQESGRRRLYYHDLGATIDDPEDDKIMPHVVNNNENIVPRASDANKRPDSVSSTRTYTSRVAFDTFDNKNAKDFSFTLSSKHKDYKSTGRSRTFLCGTDENDYSEFALEWLLEELVEEGDEIVCLRVVNPDSKINSDVSVQQGIYREEARKLLEHFQKKNEDGKAINLVLELAVGKVEEIIQAMIKTYAPACLIVGTKGKSLGGIQGLRKGSVSKYCLQNSPVPVVVVRPKEKRMKKKLRRSQDPRRQNYKSILEQSSANGNGGFDSLVQAQKANEQPSSETEAHAVAKAIGLNKEALDARNSRPPSADGAEMLGAPLTRTVSGRSEGAYETESPSPTGPLLMADDEVEEVPEMRLPESVDDGDGDGDGGGEEGDTGKSEEQGEGGRAEDEKGARGGRAGGGDGENLQIQVPDDEVAMAGKGKENEA